MRWMVLRWDVLIWEALTFHWGYMLVSGRVYDLKLNPATPPSCYHFLCFHQPALLVDSKKKVSPKFNASSDSSFLEHRPQENVWKTAMQCQPPKIESDESVAEPKIGPDCLKSNSPPISLCNGSYTPKKKWVHLFPEIRAISEGKNIICPVIIPFFKSAASSSRKKNLGSVAIDQHTKKKTAIQEFHCHLWHLFPHPGCQSARRIILFLSRGIGIPTQTFICDWHPAAQGCRPPKHLFLATKIPPRLGCWPA